MRFDKPDPAPQEAAGLRWLAAGGARVPATLGERPGTLSLQRIPAGRLDAAGEAELGGMLATLHRAGASRFGEQPGPGAFRIGLAELTMPAGDWPEVYRGLCAPLGERLGLDLAGLRVEAPAEPPSRLHGDLWWGNVLADDAGRPWLVDPAAYGGHREVDLAMLALFGPVPARTLAAYEEVWPLADGWRERVGLWQLLPLLVHAVLFGGGYVRRAEALTRTWCR